MARECKYVTILAAVVYLAAIGYAGIYNGSFELIAPDPGLNFDPPAGWVREPNGPENYTAVVERFIPEPTQGNTNKWSIDVNEGLLPIMGERLVVLSTGDQYTDKGSVQQEVYLYAGEVISGYYFFGTCDYIEWNDYATIKLTPTDSNMRDLTLVYIDVGDVDDNPNDTDGKSMDGWGYFEYEIGQDEGGTYEMKIIVEDIGDEKYESYFAVDGLALCERPPYGDINHDCRVNFEDFSWLANDWFQDCNDPNYYEDPNSFCRWGADIDGDGPVDTNDLMLLTDYWLFEP